MDSRPRACGFRQFTKPSIAIPVLAATLLAAIHWLIVNVVFSAVVAEGEFVSDRAAFEFIANGVALEDVRNLEQTSGIWKGYELFMRFEADLEVLVAFLENGRFKPEVGVDLCELERRYRSHGKRIISGWEPTKLKAPEVYVAIGARGNPDARHYTAIDWDRGIVLVYGWGT